MTTPEDVLARLRRFNAGLRQADAAVSEAVRDLPIDLPEAAFSAATVERAIELESIILRRTRPVLAIKQDETELLFVDEDDSAIWRDRLTRARPFLDRAIRAVGRIELSGSRLDWVGTGWLVADGILVTNRHVAEVFVARGGDGLAFRMGTGGRIGAAVDFLQEVDNAATLLFRLLKPLHVERASGPDLAFFEIEIVGGDARPAQPIDLAANPAITEHAATIGYPAYDSRIPDNDLMERIYGRIYNKKRLAPGGVTRIEATRILHDCTTLGGNSGSVVLDLDSGEAVGLHFSGSFLATNYAVRSDVVRGRLADMRAGRTRDEQRPGPARPRPARTIPTGDDSATATVTIPLTITVTVGAPRRPAPPARPAPRAPFDDPADIAQATEATVDDYRAREGYSDDFLGDDLVVPLPSTERIAGDVLPIEGGEQADDILRYQHFSVVMSRERRMCLFSAVNIDGNSAKKNKRGSWKWDPRLPRAQQIMNECYGSPPRFSRGHMTRREDPAWGDQDEANLGNADFMHVTNVTPQMQAFNSPIWLALEDYALGHAKEDAMRISVFTGPYFSDDDPEMYGVRIPIAFWKIIAFIHDETGALCATGYEMDQRQSLPEEEFVFGPFTSPQLGIATQVPIAAIERRSGLGFGQLADVDPLSDDEEGLADDRAPLEMLEQIRFVR